MRSYRQEYCPIVRAAEILAERWTPIIVRNLLLGCETFSEIAAGAPGISETLLSQRLRTLEQHGIIDRSPNPRRRGSLYRLTEVGRGLQEVCDAMGTWGARWLDVAPKNLDPGIVLWAVANTMDRDRLPKKRLVVRFELRDAPKQKFWLLVQRPEPELCKKHPGFDEDLVFRTDTEWLTRWHAGRISLRQAMRNEVIEIEGLASRVREFAACGGQSPFAGISPSDLRLWTRGDSNS